MMRSAGRSLQSRRTIKIPEIGRGDPCCEPFLSVSKILAPHHWILSQYYLLRLSQDLASQQVGVCLCEAAP